MKILYIVHQFYPDRRFGTERFVYQVAKSTQRAGHEVHVVTYGCRRSLHLRIIRRMRLLLDSRRNPAQLATDTYHADNISVTAFQYRRPPGAHNSANESPTAQFAAKVLRQLKPDILHVAHMRNVMEFVHTAPAMQIPYLMTVTDGWPICPKFHLLTSDGELCGGPRGGKRCQSACPEIDARAAAARLQANSTLLASASGGMVERIHDGVNGYIVRRNDVEHLRQTLDRIIQAPQLLNTLKANIRPTALPTIEEEASRYRDYYERMATAPRRMR
jgi:glycosyltransferase involved in cell wall biosynthesis